MLAAGLTAGLAQSAFAAPFDPSGRPTDLALEAALAESQTSMEKGTVLSLGEGDGSELYIVQLGRAAVPSYDGDVEGLAATKPDLRAGQQFESQAAPAVEYRELLREDQAELTAAIADQTGREPTVRFTYTNAMNGLAVELTRDEALAVSGMPGVVSVQVDETRELQTDVGPEWIGAPAIWDGSGTPTGAEGATKGEGIVAGIIDSGINPSNPSFAATVPVADGGDAYVHTNPLGENTYLGFCDPENEQFDAEFQCNAKLIGGYAYSGDPSVPFDDNGHGSHTASTTAGNQVDATVYSAPGTEFEFSSTRTIKGVAPHANIISYDVCAVGCSLAAITAAIDQAILDEVDVINYSIGSPAPSANPWADGDAVGFLNARAAGIYVATSAGNDGPGAATVGSPADIPWVTSVGAAQHDRQWQAFVQDLTADGDATFPDIQGLAFSAPSGGPEADPPTIFPLVYAGDAPYNNPLCGIPGGTAGDGEFPAGTDLTGLIIVCDRGVSGRVEKGQNVAPLGAEGMVLLNEAASGDSLNGDAHALPAAQITYDDGVALKDWMETVENEQASLSGGIYVQDDALGDIMASFSSRGPNRSMDIISPNVTGPGVDVMAAYGANNEVRWDFISGTSMSSPHVAGSLALLKAANETWTPAEAQSALMMTAKTDVTDDDGTPADWFDMGSGREDLTVAANAGLVMDETETDYLAANPAEGGDPKSLNLPSMADSQCLEVCSWTRTVTGTSTGAGDWTVAGESVTDGVTVTVEPSAFTIADGESLGLTITADVTGSGTEDYQFGNVTLTHESAPAAHMPVAVLPSTGVLPQEINIDTRRDAGSQESEPIESIEITDLRTDVTGLAPATEKELSIQEDSTNGDPYDGNGTHTEVVQVPEGAARLIASLSDSTAPDMDLFVGTGVSPSAATQVCASATATAEEFCDIGLPEDGPWWIVVQNWDASAPGAFDTVTLGTAIVAGDEGNLRFEGPESSPAGEPFTLRAFYDEPELDAGETWYGAVTLGSSADSPGDIGTIPVTLNRFADDVTKTASTTAVEPGGTITYTLQVRPNVTPEDLAYTINDTLPEGTTYVEGSATNGATYGDGVVTWEGTMPTAVGAQGSYDITTNADDTSCAMPFGETGEYIDLQSLGIPSDPAFEGDRVANTYGAEVSYFGDYYDAFSVTDDGYTVFDTQTNWVPSAAPGTPQTLPDPALPSNLAPPLWGDYEIVYDEETNTGVTVATLSSGGVPTASVIEYDGPQSSDGSTPGDFETFVWYDVSDAPGDYEIFYAYDNVSSLPEVTTIGAENAAGTIGSALVNNASPDGQVADGTIVCLDYVGPQLGTQVIQYQVTVDEDATGTLTNAATHITDNPGAEPVTVSTDVAVIIADGARPAVHRGNTWFTRDSLSTGVADDMFRFGTANDVPLYGDFDGDDDRTPAVYRPSNRTFYWSNNADGTGPVQTMTFGTGGDRPVVGDWDGDGVDSFGVFRPSNVTWFLRDELSSGAAADAYLFGNASDVPVTGDWDGDGRDTLGVRRASNSTFYLSNQTDTGQVTGATAHRFGRFNDRPVVEDWDNDGADTPGLFRPSNVTWYYANELTPTLVADGFFLFGGASDTPLTWR